MTSKKPSRPTPVTTTAARDASGTAQQKPHVIFMLLEATPEWLSLSRKERTQFAETVLAPLMARYPALEIRWFDAEAYTAECSDVLMIETGDLAQHRHFINALRDTDFFQAPFFDVTTIVPAVEQSFKDHDNHLAVVAGTDAENPDAESDK